MGLTGLSVSRLRIGGVRDVGVVVIVVLVVGCWQVKRSEEKIIIWLKTRGYRVKAIVKK